MPQGFARKVLIQAIDNAMKSWLFLGCQKRGFVRFWLAVLSIALADGCCIEGYAAKMERNATSSELKALFELVTRELPEKMVLAAEIEIREPPMAPDQLEAVIARDIQEAIEAERSLAKKAGGLISDSDLESLGESIDADLRKRFSGERKLRRREWYSRKGKLFRNDWLDYLSLDSDPILRTNILSGNIPTHLSEISLAVPGLVTDPRFPKGSGISINHGIQSASVHKGGDFTVDEPELWQVLSLRGELAFPIGVLLAEEDSIPQDPPFRDMLSGAKLDSSKLEQATEGDVLGWRIYSHDEVLGGRKVSRINMVGQPKSIFNQILGAMVENASNVEVKEELADAASAEYSYWIGSIGTSERPRLLKAEKKVPGKSQLVSTREWDETTKQISRWVKSNRNLKTGEDTRVSYHFQEMELAATFSEDEVFGYGQLSDLRYVDYDNRMIQFPEGVNIINSLPTGKGLSEWWKKLILFSLVLLPVLFIRKVLKLSVPSKP